MSERIGVYRGAFVPVDVPVVQIPTPNPGLMFTLRTTVLPNYGLQFHLQDPAGGTIWIHSLVGCSLKELEE